MQIALGACTGDTHQPAAASAAALLDSTIISAATQSAYVYIPRLFMFDYHRTCILQKVSELERERLVSLQKLSSVMPAWPFINF